MPFEEITKREPSGERRLPASMSLRGKKGTRRPATYVALSAELVKLAGIKQTDKFSIAFGTGDEAGKMRIQAKGSALFTGRIMKHALLIDLGYVARFGSTPCPKKMTDARVVEPGVVEVDIPDFAAAIAAAEDEDDEGEETTAPAEAPRQPPRTPIAAPENATELQVVGDLKFDRAAGKEKVIRDRLAIDVTKRGLEFIFLLARAMPQPVAFDFLKKRMWSAPPAEALSILSALHTDLKARLAEIGLETKQVRGVGYQLLNRK